MTHEFKSQLYEGFNKFFEHYKDKSKPSREDIKQRNKEIDFLVELIPGLMPFFMDKWCSQTNFNPVEIKKRNEWKSSNNKSITLHNYNIYIPTSLGIIDKYLFKEFGVPLMTKESDFWGFGDKMGYNFSFYTAVGNVYGEEIKSRIYEKNKTTIEKVNQDRKRIKEGKPADISITREEHGVAEDYYRLCDAYKDRLDIWAGTFEMQSFDYPALHSFEMLTHEEVVFKGEFRNFPIYNRLELHYSFPNPNLSDAADLLKSKLSLLGKNVEIEEIKSIIDDKLEAQATAYIKQKKSKLEKFAESLEEELNQIPLHEKEKNLPRYLEYPQKKRVRTNDPRNFSDTIQT